MRDWDAMHEFLGKMYRPDLPLRARSCFEWQFAADGGGDLTLLNAWDGRRLVGILGYVGIDVLWGSENPVDGAYVLNWMADPEYRGGTAIGFLRWIEKRAAVVLGCDTSAQTNRIVPRLGWELFEELPRCVAVLDPHRAGRLAMPGWTAGEIEKLAIDDAREPCSTWSPLEGEEIRSHPPGANIRRWPSARCARSVFFAGDMACIRPLRIASSRPATAERVRCARTGSRRPRTTPA